MSGVKPGSVGVRLAGVRLWAAWAVVGVVAVWALAALGFGAVGVASWLGEVQPVVDRMHVDAWYEEGVRVRPLAGGVAAAAGLPTGRLVAIDGRPVAAGETLPAVAARLRGPVGGAVRLSVEGDDGTRGTFTLSRAAGPAPVWRAVGLPPRVYDALLVALCLLRLVGGGLCAAYFLTQRPRSLVALVGVVFLLGLAGDSLTNLVLHEVGPLWTGAAGVLVPALENVFVFALFAFLAIFPDGRVRPRWAWVLLPLGLVGGWVTTTSSSLWLWVAVLLPVIGALVAARVVRFRHAGAVERQQTKWVLLGLVAFFAMFAAFLPLSFHLLASADRPTTATQLWTFAGAVAVGRVGELFLCAGLIVSLARYRLWDAEAAWSRSAAYAALSFLLAATVAGLTAVGQGVLGNDSGPLALGLATAAAVLLFDPLQDRLRAWADARFLADLQALRRDLPPLVDHLRETESAGALAAAVLARVAPVVHAGRSAVVTPRGEVVAALGVEVEEVERWAAAEDLGDALPAPGPKARRHPWRAVVGQSAGDPLFPVRVALGAERAAGGLAVEGWLLLGPRPDGSGYGPDDLEAVAEVAAAVGRALRVVRVRERRWREWERRLAELREEVGAR